MSDIVIKVENVSKQYRLGEVGTGSLAHDVNRWWHLVRGKEDPYLKIGEVNDRTKKVEKRKEKGENADPSTSTSAFLPSTSPTSTSAFALSNSSSYAWALRDVSFEVKQGEVLGIIGRNGAGKSTLLKILSRVTTPTTGQVKVKGRIASLLEVGTGFHPELTGRENIYINGAILGMRKHEITRKLDEIIEFSGCERYIDTPVKRYSSGMYVRLAFAVAAHLEPEILIIDEVLAVGDAEFQKKCLGKMKDVAGQGRTVLFVSHNLQAVETLCSRAILMDQGAISSQGNTNSIVAQHLKLSILSSIYQAAKVTSKSPRIDRVVFTDDSGNLRESVHPGDRINVEITLFNPLNDKLAIELAFFDVTGHKLWSFLQENERIPAISEGPFVTVRISFPIPVFTVETITTHIGLRQYSQINSSYIDLVCENLGFRIRQQQGEAYVMSNSLIKCDNDFEVIKYN